MRRRSVVLLAALLPIATCTGYLLLWPTGLEPEAWQPAPAPAVTENHALDGAEVRHHALLGPEAIALDPRGRLLTGLRDGQIVRIDADGVVETLANTGGRPLGLEVDPAGRLLVADARRGLLAVDARGAVSVLATGHGGRPFRFVDDLAIAVDGTVYFTDASDRFTVDDYKLEILEHRPRGRVLAYHPDTGAVELVADGLYFANGVALGPGDDYLLVSETSSYRIQRVWLGARRGQREVFADNLPGFPDNIRWSPTRRVFWVAIGSPRDALVDRLATRPFLRQIAARLPGFLQPGPRPSSAALGFDESGRQVLDLQAHGAAAYTPIASVLEHGGKLYLGSFLARGIGVIDAPPLPAAAAP